ARRGHRRDAVNVGERQARVGHGVSCRLDVQTQGGVAGQLADAIGLGGARDDDSRAHGASGASSGPKTGRLMSPRCSKATRSGMSSTRASGVAGTPVMPVIIRGPSASWTTAMAYGPPASKPGAGRWLMT